MSQGWIAEQTRKNEIIRKERLRQRILEEQARKKQAPLPPAVPPVSSPADDSQIVMLGQNDPNLPKPQQPFNMFQPTEIPADDRLAGVSPKHFRKTPSLPQMMMGSANEMIGGIDEGIGKFFGETGPIDRFKKSKTGGLLGGLINRAGGLMGDPAFRGFAGMMDESSYYDPQGFYGGVGRGLSSAGTLYDAAVKSQSGRIKAHADLLAAQGKGLKSDKTPKPVGYGFEAREFIDKTGRKKWMLSVASNMRPDWEDFGGERRLMSKYEPNVMSHFEGMVGNSVDELRERLEKGRATKFDGRLLRLGETQEKAPSIGDQRKMMDEIRNAKESLTMLHSVLGRSPSDRGTLGESFLGTVGTAAGWMGGAVAELAQIMGQPNWLEGTKIGKTRKLQTTMSKIKAGLWRSLVGRGQLSAADYKFIDDNLGVFSWGKDEGLVRFSLGKVVERLDRVISMNSYLLSKGKTTPWQIQQEWSKYDSGDPNSLILEAAKANGMEGEYSLDQSAEHNQDLSRTLIPSSQDQWTKKRNTTNKTVVASYNAFTGAGSPFKQRRPNIGAKRGTPQEEKLRAALDKMFGIRKQ